MNVYHSHQYHIFGRPLNALMEVNQALLAAIESLGNKDKKEKVSSRYKVEGPQSELTLFCKCCVQ